MIKQLLEYTDIDEQRTTRTVMFNLTQFEVEGEMELEVIQSRFQKFQDEVIGNDPEAPLRDMTGPEKREILAMIKTLIKHSYGVRDGKRFRKTRTDSVTGQVTDPEIWAEFEESGAFSAFLYWLFEKPERANGFMTGIWPQGVDRPEDGPRPDLKVVTDAPDDGKSGVTVIEEDNTPSIDPGPSSETAQPDQKPWHEYTQQEMDSLSDEDFDALLRRSKKGNNIPHPLLIISQQRKNRGVTE